MQRYTPHVQALVITTIRRYHCRSVVRAAGPSREEKADSRGLGPHGVPPDVEPETKEVIPWPNRTLFAT